ncbi:uncharacterized protein LOC126744714 isoform X2 [Anthonomus grandis grandis]|uniref:uncharacterized protein LOC126744714 isoform X2 n=1 Tax=Anthonomus grandis grandis TaxID=2921223 RepID=UPI0021666DB3|nr:uncharacterized protein LOC126744714 isoform X2 [Anthonomus grandis grandis]
MSINRVQKLLISEYCDFEDLVLIESPFAQTTKDGKGVRQVHLGLTPSKLILATDVLPPVDRENVRYNPLIDPEIETFELIAIYPVECVNLSIYRRKRRQALKARFCNNKVLYFELGGFERRGMFWNLWCEKVKFLCPSNSNSSRSETSVATSTTGSSLYLLDKKLVTINGIRQLWCKFGPNISIDTKFISNVVANNSQGLGRKWTDRYLYLGKDLHESSLDYRPIVRMPYLDEFVKPRKKKKTKKAEYPALAYERGLSFGDTVQVNRFGSGISENCGTGLYLPFDDYIVPKRYSATMVQTDSSEVLSLDWDTEPINYEELAETAVLMWEYYGFSCMQNGRRTRHRRRYGFAPKPLFLYGLGPWHATKGDNFSLQIKRAVSDVNVRHLNCEKKLPYLPLSKRQLFATVSCPSLEDENLFRANNIMSIFFFRNAPKKPVIFFWTPGYWYRPISAKDAYNELQKHLKKIRNYHESVNKNRRRRCNGRRFLRKFNGNKLKETDEDDDCCHPKKRKNCFITNILGNKFDDSLDWDETKQPHETALQHLKRILRVDECWVSAWDFDSTTLAQQLTLIDRDLFLKVSPAEFSVLMWQQSSKNAPNVAAMIAFSYRISCLIASEILKDESERIRARLMARFINVANKCHRMSNFQSCRTVLCGLQNPAVFRLRKTWAYVRKKHASKYQAFEFLCRLYRDPRMPSFQRSFFLLSQRPPFLPYIGHLIAKLLDKVPEYKIRTFGPSRQLSFCTTKSFRSCSTLKSRKVEPQLNLFSKIFSAFVNPTAHAGDGDRAKAKPQKTKKKTSKTPKFRGLYEYFKPLSRIEDNRKAALQEVTEMLEKCQLGALNYTFTGNDVARNYLLKARHREEEENFFISLGLESSRFSNNNASANKND